LVSQPRSRAAGAEPRMRDAHLARLESDSIFIIREAFAKVSRLAMLWSMGKDSTVLLWLVRKAFLGHVPLPLVHIDTTFKIPSMIEYRDRIVREWNLHLVVSKHDAALAEKRTYPDGALTRVECCSLLKKDALGNLLAAENYTGLIVGVRRDEEPTRAKERYFSPRGARMEWDVVNQPPEFWDQFQTDFQPGTHVRVHPLLHWTEIDVWKYIRRERIEVMPLYFDQGKGERYRSLGCWPCTSTVKSTARSVDDIIAELEATRAPERAGRAQDQESEAAFEILRRDGYM
jgi:sulfate adenylyltransferase subunit 2